MGKTREQQLAYLKSIGVNALPDNPSQDGYGAMQIKEAISILAETEMGFRHEHEIEFDAYVVALQTAVSALQTAIVNKQKTLVAGTGITLVAGTNNDTISIDTTALATKTELLGYLAKTGGNVDYIGSDEYKSTAGKELLKVYTLDNYLKLGSSLLDCIRVQNNLLPYGNGFDLGSSTLKWRDLFLGGSIKNGTKSISVAAICSNAGVERITGSWSFETLPVTLANRNIVSDRQFVDREFVNTVASGKADKTTTINGHALSNNVTVTKGDVGLSNVTNDAQVKASEKGVASGVATLDSNAKIPLSQIPDSVFGQLEYKGTWNATSGTSGLTANKGDYYVCQTGGSKNPDTTSHSGSAYEIGDWAVYNGSSWDKVDNTDAVQSVNGKTGAVVLNKTDVGLGNIDNTSDLSKPISSATQTALDTKLSITNAENNYQAKMAHKDITILYSAWNASNKAIYSNIPNFVVNEGDTVLCTAANITNETYMATYGVRLDSITTTGSLTTIEFSCVEKPKSGTEELSVAIRLILIKENVVTSSSTVLSNNSVDNQTIEYANSVIKVKSGVFASQSDLNGKQATLVSGSNIKTINNQSLLGSGNIVVAGEPSAYLKNASVSGNTLTLTKKDDSTVTFTPSGGGGTTLYKHTLTLTFTNGGEPYEDIYKVVAIVISKKSTALTNGDLIDTNENQNFISRNITFKDGADYKKYKVLSYSFDYYCVCVEIVYGTISYMYGFSISTDTITEY